MAHKGSTCCGDAGTAGAVCTVKPRNREGFDLAVIGAGSAGFSAAITAAQAGARVLLVGHGTIGGTCVNIGCVPSKTLIRAAEALHGPRSAQRFAGICAQGRLVDWGAVLAQKDELVAGLRRKKYLDLLPAYPQITYREGRARLLPGGGVAVDGREIRAERIVIATGARPAAPGIPGIHEVDYLTSTTALALEALPRSLLVIGGGYVGCELAQMFSRFGVKVTLVTRHRLLKQAEPEVSEALTGYLRAEGMEVKTGLSYRRIARVGDGVALTIARDGREEVLRAAQLLVTAGRLPNTQGLGLKEAGVLCDDRGAVVVDEYMRSSRPGVYAAGDVTGRDMFVYMAAYGAKIAARNALEGDHLRYDNRAMPWVVFTDPEVAGAGMSEAEARAAGHEVKTALFPLDELPRALAARDTRGLIKLVADAEDDRLLGGQILAPHGADSVGLLALALKQRLTARDLAETVLPYLTTVEGLRLAAQTFEIDVAKLSCCAG